MTQGHGMPPGRGPWVRVVALLAVVALVLTVGYTTLAVLAAPSWALWLAVLLAVIIGIVLFNAQGSGR